MKDYDIMFSDFTAMSNSLQRPIPPGTPMNSEHLLQLFWENNLW